MAADNITCPDDFDPDDVDYAKTLVDEGSFVRGMITVVWWMTPDGEFRWRCYNATAEAFLSESIGVLEMAQADLMNRTQGWLPAPPDDDE